MKRNSLMTIAVLVWLVAALAGMWAMMAYANEPGEHGLAPNQWPRGTRLGGPSDLPVLILFAHPRCPCSRASIDELALLMANNAGRVAAHVVFLDLEEWGVNGRETELWRAAQLIPGVVVERDTQGREAKIFGSATSGDVLLYDTTGRLIFHGGITLARGHAGDNPGRSAIHALLRDVSGTLSTTPVFGCELFTRQGEGAGR